MVRNGQKSLAPGSKEVSSNTEGERSKMKTCTYWHQQMTTYRKGTPRRIKSRDVKFLSLVTAKNRSENE